ncbi:MAG: DNA mismatch repair endonuclease MutL [candidate division Zixibacteria bacterium]
MTNFSDNKFARPIEQLDRNLINKIAAGEVIERPASVIKEAIENSFDAGATSVEVTAEKAGTTYISVVDNGCGIPTAQVKLAFSRHATSKIRIADDLFAVNSYGFRGEALPSIASVAHLSLTTRHYKENEGTFIAIEGGREVDFRPVSAPIGTKVEISHLFFNTPARKKFLKSETTELRQIIRVAERMALGKPSVAVKLTLNERQTFQLPQNQPIAERMATLFGVKPDGIVEYDIEMGGVYFLAYLAHPDHARHDRTRICLYINGRSVASSSLIHAVTSGYGEFLPPGRFPLAVIYITVDPSRLDVNVHPTKAEVRLSEERAIHDNLYRIVKKALRDWRLIPSSDHQSYNKVMKGNTSGFQSQQNMNLQSSRPLSRTPLSNRHRNQQNISGTLNTFTSISTSEPAGCDNRLPAIDETSVIASQAAAEVKEITSDDIVYLGKVGRQYLVLSIGGELYIVDQHTAHERVLYEYALEQVEKGSAASQKLLFPETVDLSAEEYLTFEAGQETLTKLGFEIDAFGGNSVVIQGVPPVFKDKNPAKIIVKLLDDIGQLKKAGGDLIKSIAQSLACRASVMAGDKLSADEVQSLLSSLLKVNNPYCCPHGRPTFVKISLDELDSRFGRA